MRDLRPNAPERVKIEVEVLPGFAEAARRLGLKPEWYARIMCDDATLQPRETITIKSERPLPAVALCSPYHQRGGAD